MTNFQEAYERISQINWSRKKNENGALLFQEYVRRAHIWREHLDCNPMIVFFDPVNYLNEKYELDEESDRLIEALVDKLRGYNASICGSFLKLSKYREVNEVPSLPDLFEPLIKLLESGGELAVINGFAEIEGQSFHLKDWGSYKSDKEYISI